MSVFSDAYVTPNRVKGTFRFVLSQYGREVDRELAEESLSPASLQPEANHTKHEHLKMIKAVIKEAIKMQLIEEKDGKLSIPEKILDDVKPDENLPYVITRLISEEGNKENQDLLNMISWYLMQDPYDAPGTWVEVNDTLLKQVGGGILGCNDIRYGQFTHWLVFLGFGWRYSFKGERTRITPDPGPILKSLLQEIFQETPVMKMKDFMEQLAAHCPVFEGGKIRNQLNRDYGIENLLPPKQLSKVTSYSLLNLFEEGYIELTYKSDADVYILADGDRQNRFSEIKWLGKGV